MCRGEAIADFFDAGIWQSESCPASVSFSFFFHFLYPHTFFSSPCTLSYNNPAIILIDSSPSSSTSFCFSIQYLFFFILCFCSDQFLVLINLFFPDKGFFFFSLFIHKSSSSSLALIRSSPFVLVPCCSAFMLCCVTWLSFLYIFTPHAFTPSVTSVPCLVSCLLLVLPLLDVWVTTAVTWHAPLRSVQILTQLNSNVTHSHSSSSLEELHT